MTEHPANRFTGSQLQRETVLRTVNGFEDLDGCPDTVPVDDEPQPQPPPDADADGVLDADDRCPAVAGIVENRGCPDLDTDGDTVVDRLDACVQQPGPPEEKGCPRPQVVVTATQLEVLDIIYFNLNSHVLSPRSFPTLQAFAATVKSNPALEKIVVEGHSDDQGDAAYNKRLSQRRAQAVVDFLVKQGVARARLEAIGFGEERPITEDTGAAGRSKNRRVEFKIVNGATR